MTKDLSIKELEEGKLYSFTLKKDTETIIDNKGNVNFQHGKEYKMFLKNKLGYVESNDYPDRYYPVTPYQSLLEYIDIKEVGSRIIDVVWQSE